MVNVPGLEKVRGETHTSTCRHIVVAQRGDGEQAVVTTAPLHARLDRALLVEWSVVAFVIRREDRLDPTKVDIAPRLPG